MLFDHVGQSAVGDSIKAALVKVLNSGVRTPDLGGKSTTLEFSDEIARELR
jgi:isocitrate/isopropylmalate dehydrogenase